MTFYDRGENAQKIALYLLERKKNITNFLIKQVPLILILGRYRRRFWYFFHLFRFGKRMLPNTPFWVDGETQKISANGTHLERIFSHQVKGFLCKSMPYNFPVWGMLEKLSTSLLAGVPAIVKPSPYSSYLTNEVFKDMIESGYHSEGAVQLVCGEPGNILDFVKDGDSVVFYRFRKYW